jgi:hypothetical protein
MSSTRRSYVPLLILIAGGTASGKTESAMRIATGLAGGKPFAVIDTENGRALHKADDYTFKHAELDEPFTPERYAEAVKAADAAGFPVIVIDSGSHEYEGIGGVLDLQAAGVRADGAARERTHVVVDRAEARHKRLCSSSSARARTSSCACAPRTRSRSSSKATRRSCGRRSRSSARRAGSRSARSGSRSRRRSALLLTADAPGVPKPIKLERRHGAKYHRDGQILQENYARGARDLAQVWAQEFETLALIPEDQRGVAVGNLVIVRGRDLQEASRCPRSPTGSRQTQPVVVYRPSTPQWPAEVARYALAIGCVLGVAVALFAVMVATGILLVGLAHVVLAATWGVPAIVTAACLLVRR